MFGETIAGLATERVLTVLLADNGATFSGLWRFFSYGVLQHLKVKLLSRMILLIIDRVVSRVKGNSRKTATTKNPQCHR